ncbi:hypothetical protein E2C01_011555 [Portunus trituberculatus]|uniref:Uncharacterized protein n=1 Tax=Portunus trituberculatus TaxID=210409 RepID=A0A5B7DBE6_PORTR|nr:hypothetical protein [Portunus trituberculatus]
MTQEFQCKNVIVKLYGSLLQHLQGIIHHDGLHLSWDAAAPTPTTTKWPRHRTPNVLSSHPIPCPLATRGHEDTSPPAWSLAQDKHGCCSHPWPTLSCR